MTKLHNHPMKDEDLKRFLKQSDPFAKPSQAFLAKLERTIFLQSGMMAQEARADGAVLPAWLIRQGLTVRSMALACALIVAMGFVVGISSGVPAAATSVSNIHSIVAMSSEPPAAWDHDDAQ